MILIQSKCEVSKFARGVIKSWQRAAGSANATQPALIDNDNNNNNNNNENNNDDNENNNNQH